MLLIIFLHIIIATFLKFIAFWELSVFQLQTYFWFYSRISLPRYEKIIPAQGEGQKLIITEEVKVFTASL